MHLFEALPHGSEEHLAEAVERNDAHRLLELLLEAALDLARGHVAGEDEVQRPREEGARGVAEHRVEEEAARRLAPARPLPPPFELRLGTVRVDVDARRIHVHRDEAKRLQLGCPQVREKGEGVGLSRRAF
jgi:hypothetical protein